MKKRALVAWIFVIVAMTLLSAGCGGGGGGGGSDNPGATDTTAPTDGTLTATAGNKQTSLSWSGFSDSGSGINSYKLVYSNTSSPVSCDTGTQIYLGTDASYNHTGLTADITYYYRVCAVDNAGNISQGAVASTIPLHWSILKLPDTGQTGDYTTTFGEDSDYTINSPSYTDNGSGTITDNVTSLMWQKEDDNITRTWYDAVSYCDALALGGYSDWRLPTKRELISIVDYGKYNPAINTTYFPNTDSSEYWSSTTSTYSTNNAWRVRFSSGDLNTPSKSNPYYVRCVHGDGETTAKSVTNNGNGTVMDNDTGLAWQQDSGGSVTWEVGLTYCENLSLAGYDDWRMPNIKELESITGVLTFSGYFWSSTTDMQKTTAAWRVYTDSGYVWDGTNSLKQDSHNIRCVRGGQRTAPDITPPTVTSTNPTSNATGVAVNSSITATFSAPMNASTITTSTFILKQGSTAIAGTVTYSGTTATFTPSSSLAYSTTYTATITTGAKDAAGNAMASNYAWSFTVSSEGGTTPGINWTLRGTGTNSYLYGVTWTGTQFVAVGENGTVLTSPDGISWTKRTTGTTALLWSVTWSGSQFVVVGEFGVGLTSSDGITWQLNNTGPIPGYAYYKADVTWFGNKFIAVGVNGKIYTSSDGVNWTTDYISPNSFYPNGVTPPGDKFAAVGNGGYTVTSPDGINWSVLPSVTTNWLYGVTWSGSQFVATGVNGTIITSADGSSWTNRTAGTSNTLYSVNWSGSQFVAAGSSGTILTSPDGITWTSRTSGTINDLNSVAWSGSRFVVVGKWGTILTSP